MSLIAKSIMNPARAVEAGTSLDEAARIMEVQRISSLPVTETDGKLIGILTKTDLLHEALSQRDAFSGRSVADAMSPAVVTCGPDSRVSEISELMRQHRVHHLMVTDGNAKLLGVVSSLDLAARVIDLCEMIDNLGAI